MAFRIDVAKKVLEEIWSLGYRPIIN